MGVAASAAVCILLFASAGFAQSVADVARQERERRQQKPCVKRVYTNEDLARPQILDANDRACLEAAREAPPAAPAAANFSANAGVRPLETGALPPLQPVVPPFHLDSLIFPYESALPDFPLAEIAPYDREMKAARLAREAQLQKAVVVSVPPGRSRLHAAAPAPGVAPSLPRFRFQPVSFDAGLPPAPPAPSRSSDVPHAVPARVEIVPPVRIVLPAASESVDLGSGILPVVRVERGDSLWKIAARRLGSGARWRALVAFNPQISDPNLIHVGDVLRLPLEVSNLRSEIGSRGSAETSGRRSQFDSAAGGPSVRVVLGDTLWALARTQFGRGSAWTCIAQANQLPNPHLILPGQTLTLPETCQ